MHSLNSLTWRNLTAHPLRSILTVLAIAGVARLEFDDVPQAILKSDDEEYRTLAEVSEQFGEDDHECLLVLRGAEIFTPEGIGILRRMVSQLQQLDGIESVRSIESVPIFEGTGWSLPKALLPEDLQPEDRLREDRIPDGQTVEAVRHL